MGLILPPIEAYQVQHLPIVQAYADQIGVVEVLNQRVASEMALDPGTIVLGLVLDTLRGRSPLYRLEECFAHQDRALLLGKAVAPECFNDDTVGRVLDRLYEVGTMKLLTACAVRADRVFGLAKRYVHFDTTSVSVFGEYLPPETPQRQEEPQNEPQGPVTITYGYSKDKRPALKQCIVSTLCVDRAVPLWGKAEDGNASAKTVNNTVLSEIATHMASYGVAPGAYISIADAARVTEDNLAALGDTLFMSRLPATYNACGRLITEAVAQNTWAEIGMLAHTKPTPHRPGTSYKAYEGEVILYGTSYRAVVLHASAQDKRRPKQLDRALQAAAATLRAAVRPEAQQMYCCQADAEAAADKVRTLQPDDHEVDVTGEACPQYGRGRPSTRRPRAVKARHYTLQIAIRERDALLARRRAEAGCFVLLTNVPSEGERGHSAPEVLKAYKEQHGTEQNYGCLKDPVIVNSLFLKKPERVEA